MSRYFSPWNGIPEDPVNGSSHTLLAPYWAQFETAMNVAAVDGGKESECAAVAEPTLGGTGRTASSVEQEQVPLFARQASPRGGYLGLVANFKTQRVKIAGPAAVAIVGTMRVLTQMS